MPTTSPCSISNETSRSAQNGSSRLRSRAADRGCSTAFATDVARGVAQRPYPVAGRRARSCFDEALGPDRDVDAVPSDDVGERRSMRRK